MRELVYIAALVSLGVAAAAVTGYYIVNGRSRPWRCPRCSSWNLREMPDLMTRQPFWYCDECNHRFE